MSDTLVTPGSAQAQERFNWNFEGRVLVMDVGSLFASHGGFKGLMGLDTFSVVTFDLSNKLEEKKGSIKDIKEFQIINNIIVGDGLPVSIYACLDNDLSATLKPLDNKPENIVDGIDQAKILANMPISTVRLDDIDDIKDLDMLVLDALNDNVSILENGSQKLSDTLVIDVEIPLKATHENQSDFCQVSFWMAQNGFRFLRFMGFKQDSKIPKDFPIEKQVASEMYIAKAIFIPNDEKLKKLSPNKLLKLSFVLHTVYKLYDMAYKVLDITDSEIAKKYLVAEGIIWPVDEDEVEFVLTEDYSPDIWAV